MVQILRSKLSGKIRKTACCLEGNRRWNEQHSKKNPNIANKNWWVQKVYSQDTCKCVILHHPELSKIWNLDLWQHFYYSCAFYCLRGNLWAQTHLNWLRVQNLSSGNIADRCSGWQQFSTVIRWSCNDRI